MSNVTFTNSRDRKLVGEIHPADSHSIIIMCHGFTSDRHSNGRFAKLIEAFNTVGYNVLNFDFSGCGESNDDVLSFDKEMDDLHAAIKFAKSKGFTHVALYGHSLGGTIALKGYLREVETIVVSGAATDAIYYEWKDYFSPHQLKELEESGHMIFPIKHKQRNHVVIDKRMLDGFAAIDQENLLKKVKCPVLLIHGNGDDEEKQLLERTKRGIHLLSKDSHFEIIEGAPHSFMNHLDELTKLAVHWYIKHLPR